MSQQIMKKVRSAFAATLFLAGTAFQTVPMDGCSSNLKITLEDVSSVVDTETTSVDTGVPAYEPEFVTPGWTSFYGTGAGYWDVW